MFPDEKVNSGSGYLNRRNFLKTGLTGGIAIAAFPQEAGAKEISPSPLSSPEIKSFELDEVTVAELQKGMSTGKYTAHIITQKYLARIAAIDKKGPALNSIIELNPDALKIADELDKERKAKGPRGPMHGIPVLIKDNIDTADRMSTTAGSLALVGSKPPADSFLVQRLRAAGAIILGKTNLSEWANIRASRSTSGWSGRGGLTRNPYALDRNCSGSSSGTGAAVAANLCAVGIGTETDGSVVSPSSINGIVGIKPTVGLVSRSGIIPISHTQDTAGPMTRTVSDAAALLSAMAAIDPQDNATSESRGKSFADYTQFLDSKGLQGARLGVVRRYFGFHDDVDALMNDAFEAMKKSGAVIIDPADIDALGQLGKAEGTVLQYDLKADLNAYLARLGPNAPVHSLKEIIEFNGRNRKTELAYFGQDTFIKAEARGPLTDKEYIDAREKNLRLSRAEGIDAIMDKYKLDALLAPTEGPAWVSDLVTGDHFLCSSSTAAAVAGYPHITVPAGFVFGLPVGISFFGRAWSEPTLIKLAYAFEQATKHRKPPRFMPTADTRV
ncbi:MAG: amidase [Ignavibacteriales bacterium]|nr:amidase [Ignavibacteriales bacterium]